MFPTSPSVVPSPSQSKERLGHAQKYQKIMRDDTPHRLAISITTSDQDQHPKPCRWAWCRLTFITNSQLVSHVVNHHIQTAEPIRRKDVLFYRRVEEGVGESLSMSGLGMSRSSQHTLSDVNIKSNSTEEPSSSLPSPPATSPPPHSVASRDDEATSQHSMLDPESGVASQPQDTMDEDSTAFRPSPSPLPLVPHTDDVAPPQANPIIRLQTPPSSATFSSPIQNSALEQSTPPTRLRNPSFASLSSPIGSFSESIYTNPPTPSFSSLVESAINKDRRRQDKHDRVLNHSASPARNQVQTPQLSPLSTSSHDSVKKQLTQDISEEDVRENYPDSQRSTPLKNLHTSNNRSSGVLGGRPTLQITPSLSKQPWYGTRPVRRMASLSSPLSDGSPIKRTPVQRAATITLFQPTKGVARSDANTTQTHHSGTSNVPLGPEVVPPEQPQTHIAAEAQSESQSQSGFSDYLSYGPLQTQAPYRSQSFSP